MLNYINPKLESSLLGIKIHRYEDDTTLMAESKELKSLLMKKGDAKIGLKLNIQKATHKKILNILGIQSHHFKAYRWGKCGSSGRFYFLGLQNHYGPWLQPQN